MQTELPKSARLVAKTISLIVIFGGLSVLYAWIFYSSVPDVIRSFLTITMPNSGFCFILSGLALWVYSDQRKLNLGYFMVKIGVAYVFISALFALYNHFFKTPYILDDSIFNTVLAQNHAATTVKLSPYSGINFFLIGFCLLFLDTKAIRYVFYQVIMTVVILFAFFVLLGHIYGIGATKVFGVPVEYSQMAVLNSTLFILLGIGIIFVRPYSEVFSILASQHSGGSFARRLIPSAIILPVITGYFVSLGGKDLGFYNADLGISIFVMLTTVLYLGFIFINAYFIERVDSTRESAEKALIHHQLQSQALLNQASSLVYIQDLEGTFLLVNKQFEKVFHLKEDVIIGKKAKDVFSKRIAKLFLDTDTNVFEPHSQLDLEQNIVTETGSYVYIFNKFPLFDEQGNIYAIGIVATDITELKQFEEEMQNAKLIAEIKT